MADEPGAKRARDTRESDRETYKLGYLMPLSDEKWKCLTTPPPTTSLDVPSTYCFPDDGYGEFGSDSHDYRELGETDYTALLAMGTEDRPREQEELRTFWHLQDFVKQAQELPGGRGSLDLRRPTNLHTSVQDMEAPVIEFCEGFKYGCNDEALRLMMRYTSSFQEIAITKDFKHFLYPTKDTEFGGVCGKASFDPVNGNMGWFFFQEDIVTSLKSMIKVFKEVDVKERDFSRLERDMPLYSKEEKAQIGSAQSHCDKAHAYLSETSNLEKIFKKQLAQALQAAGQYAAQPPSSVAVTCFFQDWAVVCSLDTARCVPISWLIARPTASFKTVPKDYCVDLPAAELGEAYTAGSTRKMVLRRDGAHICAQKPGSDSIRAPPFETNKGYFPAHHIS